jgi:chlorite dismutase
MIPQTTRGSRPVDSITFLGGQRGPWQVERIDAVRGAGLPPVPAVDAVHRLEGELPAGVSWSLRGVTEESHYATSAEDARLLAIQPELGRPDSTWAALIPIRKSRMWWDRPPAERRAIFEERSHHISVGLEHLPAVARRLYHGRALGEPFDFLTWFEYAPEDAASFDRLVGRLRETEEWSYVEREVDIRLRRRSRRSRPGVT